MVTTVEVDEEDALIQQSSEALNDGQPLATVWHNILNKVSTSRMLAVLKKIMKGRREVTFLCMTAKDITQKEIEKAVQRWDCAEHLMREKRRKGAQPMGYAQGEKQRRESYPPAQPAAWEDAGNMGYYPPQESQPPRNPPRQQERHVQPFHQTPYFERQGPPD